MSLTNGLVVYFGGFLVKDLKSAYAELLENSLPSITIYSLQIQPVFFGLAIAAFTVVILNWKGKLSELKTFYLAAGLVAINFLVVLFAVLGFVAPFFTLSMDLNDLCCE